MYMSFTVKVEYVTLCRMFKKTGVITLMACSEGCLYGIQYSSDKLYDAFILHFTAVGSSAGWMC